MTSVSGLSFESIKIRKLIIKALLNADRGHIGSSFSLVEILIALYMNISKITAKNVHDINRDRIILSKGHGCLALYAVLVELKIIEENELLTFCKFDSHLGGHPEYGHTPGIEASTGSLGHGLSIGVGLAYSMILKKISSKVFVIVGDGELQEGSNWEALLSASKNNLDNLVVIVDYNKMQSYDYTNKVVDLEPLRMKFESFGCEVNEADGHDLKILTTNLKSLIKNKNKKPKVLIANTIKGKGIVEIENNLNWHHKTKFSENELKILLDF